MRNPRAGRFRKMIKPRTKTKVSEPPEGIFALVPIPGCGILSDRVGGTLALVLRLDTVEA